MLWIWIWDISILLEGKNWIWFLVYIAEPFFIWFFHDCTLQLFVWVKKINQILVQAFTICSYYRFSFVPQMWNLYEGQNVLIFGSYPGPLTSLLRNLRRLEIRNLLSSISIRGKNLILKVSKSDLTYVKLLP